MRRPTNHRIRQELIEAEIEYEDLDAGMAFLAAVVCSRLGITPHDVFEAVTENSPPETSATGWVRH